MYKPHTTSCGLKIGCSTQYSISGYRFNSNSLLNEPIEKHSPGTGCPSIEAKSELIQVIFQMRTTNSALVRSNQPTFKKCDNSIDQWQQVVSYTVIIPDNLMVITKSFKPSVSAPTIRANNRTRFYTFLNGRSKAACGSIVDFPKTDSSDPLPVLLGHYKYKCFPCSSPTTVDRLFTTDISFINFYSTTDSVSTWAHHCHTQFVQHSPCSPITTKPQRSLKPKSAYPVLLISDVPNRSKPRLQRLLCILKNCSCRYRGLVSAFSTFVQPSISFPSFLTTTSRTNKSFRPSQPEKIFFTSSLRAKSLLEFHKGSRVSFHTRAYYILGLVESSA